MTAHFGPNNESPGKEGQLKGPVNLAAVELFRKQRTSLIAGLLLTEEDPKQAKSLLNGLIKLGPDKKDILPVLTALLAHNSSEIRLESALLLKNYRSVDYDLLPILFVAQHKERNEELRNTFKEIAHSIDNLPGREGAHYRQLSDYYEQLRYTAYA